MIVRTVDVHVIVFVWHDSWAPELYIVSCNKAMIGCIQCITFFSFFCFDDI